MGRAVPGVEAHRHDRAWLAPDRVGAVPEAARAWIDAGHPAVVARQSPLEPDLLRLGVTLPPRRRLALVVPRSAVVRIEPPPRLADVLAVAPASWRPRIGDVLRLGDACGFVPQVYGSLAAEAASGAAVVTPESDLDLLFAVEPGARLERLLDGLRALDGGVPRLDGEVRNAAGWAANWREVERVLRGGGGRLLGKSDSAVAWIDVRDFVAGHAPSASIQV